MDKSIVDRNSGRVSELEDELHQTLKRYETIFRATHDVLYDLDLDTSKVVWNEALYSQYGYNEDEPADKLEWWAGHIHPDDALDVERDMSALLESKNSNWNCEYRFRRADGSYVEVRDRGYILRAPEGLPLRIVGSFLDISQQKQLERAKDEFSSLISHQLRTPLTVIQMYSDLLVGGMFGALSPEQSHEVAKIHASSVMLIELVNDILAISSIELQKFRVSLSATNLNDLIRGCIESVQPLADDKSVAFSFVPNPRLNSSMVDQRLLEQILHNLLTNAIRYTAAGKGRVDIAAVEASRADVAIVSAGGYMPGPGYIISVKDNGIGIPRADRPHVFDRFYRANNAINSESHGTGLGLYYVHIVTEAIGGKVWFKTAKNKGTTFYIYIPSRART